MISLKTYLRQHAPWHVLAILLALLLLLSALPIFAAEGEEATLPQEVELDESTPETESDSEELPPMTSNAISIIDPDRNRCV